MPLMTPMALADERDELVAEYDTGDYHSSVYAYVCKSVFPGQWVMWCARGSGLLTIDSWYPSRAAAVAQARVFVEARRAEVQSAPTDEG